MTLLFATMLLLIVASLAAVHFFARLRRLKASMPSIDASGSVPGVFPVSNRYQPMLRLLSPDDEAMVAANKVLAKKLKRQRTEIFREYLSCLSGDYGRLLAGVRTAMARSGVDRPDLASALAKNQALFTLALCRVEYRLFLHNLGLGSVDVSGLVDAIGVLRSQISVSGPVAAGAR